MTYLGHYCLSRLSPAAPAAAAAAPAPAAAPAAIPAPAPAPAPAAAAGAGAAAVRRAQPEVKLGTGFGRVKRCRRRRCAAAALLRALRLLLALPRGRPLVVAAACTGGGVRRRAATSEQLAVVEGGQMAGQSRQGGCKELQPGRCRPGCALPLACLCARTKSRREPVLAISCGWGDLRVPMCKAGHPCSKRWDEAEKQRASSCTDEITGGRRRPQRPWGRTSLPPQRKEPC